MRALQREVASLRKSEPVRRPLQNEATASPDDQAGSFFIEVVEEGFSRVRAEADPVLDLGVEVGHFTSFARIDGMMTSPVRIERRGNAGKGGNGVGPDVFSV